VMGCPIRVADVGLTGQFFCGLYRVRRPAPDLVPDLWERLQPHRELLKVVVSQPSHGREIRSRATVCHGPSPTWHPFFDQRTDIVAVDASPAYRHVLRAGRFNTGYGPVSNEVALLLPAAA
jgi:hypothetical protein